VWAAILGYVISFSQYIQTPKFGPSEPGRCLNLSNSSINALLDLYPPLLASNFVVFITLLQFGHTVTKLLPTVTVPVYSSHSILIHTFLLSDRYSGCSGALPRSQARLTTIEANIPTQGTGVVHFTYFPDLCLQELRLRSTKYLIWYNYGVR